MRRLLAVLVGGLGIGALLRHRRRRAPEAEPVEELRAKLAESRAAETALPPADQGLDARRQAVHDEARRAAEELR